MQAKGRQFASQEAHLILMGENSCRQLLLITSYEVMFSSGYLLALEDNESQPDP